MGAGNTADIREARLQLQTADAHRPRFFQLQQFFPQGKDQRGNSGAYQIPSRIAAARMATDQERMLPGHIFRPNHSMPPSAAFSRSSSRGWRESSGNFPAVSA